MKYLITIITLTLSCNLFAQSIIKATSPVFPGCEKIDANNNFEMENCFKEKLSEKINLEIDKYTTQLDSLNIDEFDARIKFNVTPEGKLANLMVLTTSAPAFRPLLIKAMKDAAAPLEVTPSQGEDGKTRLKGIIMELSYDQK